MADFRGLPDLVAAQVSKVAPIVGISIGVVADKLTWRIDFAAGATGPQMTAAQTVVNNFVVPSDIPVADPTPSLVFLNGKML